ncbi:hypothetical protein ACI5KX_09110 [Erythrobacter sp. GH1-10]|uniref:hypothetical protein n=1 Tax=Erythrobacter sp. GH1-10 TaxID=3349334 RepID=UPI003877CA3C
MSTPPFPQWCEAAPDAEFSASSDCAARIDRFERRIRIRNGIEYGAGAMVCVLFTAAAIAAASVSEWLIAIAFALTVVGAIVVMKGLYTRGSNVDRRPEDPCLVHLERQYRRQYEALRDVPKWYIAPLIPGIAMFYAVVSANVAAKAGWHEALLGLTGPLALTLAIFIGVAAANWIAARALKRKLALLEDLA